MKYYPDRGLHVMVCLNEHGNSGMEGIKYPILNLIWKTVWFWAELKPEESEVWRMYFYPLGLVFTALREKKRRLREMYLKNCEKLLLAIDCKYQDVVIIDKLPSFSDRADRCTSEWVAMCERTHCFPPEVYFEWICREACPIYVCLWAYCMLVCILTDGPS